MSEQKYRMLEEWEELKEDLGNFSKNPYEWLESELERLIIPPESGGVASFHRVQQRDLKNLLGIFKMVNGIYSPRLKKKI